MADKAGGRIPPDPKVVPTKSILKKGLQRTIKSPTCPLPASSAGAVHEKSPTGGTAASDSKKTRAKFDEMNIIETLHPVDKEYGHITIDEPKTPYNGPTDPFIRPQTPGGVDPARLTASLNSAAGSPPRVLTPDLSPGELSDDESSPDPSSEDRQAFLAQRKTHYNEFQSVKGRKPTGPSENPQKK